MKTLSEPTDYHLTELGNAGRFANLHGDKIRFCHILNCWYIWSGSHWKRDSQGLLRALAKDVPKLLYKEAAEKRDSAERAELAKFAIASESRQKIEAMIYLTQSEPGVPITHNQLDTNPWLFNCLQGTVDIRTGDIQPHDPDHYITRCVEYPIDTDAHCPKWKRHLDIIFGGNTELIEFFQRAVGSCLSGDTSDRKLFIQYGSGKNGKTVTNETLAMVLGKYAMKTPAQTLLVKRGNNIPNDLARLRGARFVYASEADQDRHLSEALVKEMTGGDKLSARFMRAEWFEFQPEFKIFLGTNHKPIIKGTDAGIWDRIALIPFTVRIPDRIVKPRHELMAQFEREVPGILGWLLQGAKAWFTNGLRVPKGVETATNEYRTEMDAIGEFIDCKCKTGDGYRIAFRFLFDEYDKWRKETGEMELTKTAFGRRLQERGFDRIKKGGEIFYAGINLDPQRF